MKASSETITAGSSLLHVIVSEFTPCGSKKASGLLRDGRSSDRTKSVAVSALSQFLTVLPTGFIQTDVMDIS
jgi:hypothetical protein